MQFFQAAWSALIHFLLGNVVLEILSGELTAHIIKTITFYRTEARHALIFRNPSQEWAMVPWTE